MLDKLIKRFEKAGKIRKQKAGIVQIEALLREAILDLEEAKNIYHMIQNGTYSQKEWAFVFRLT
jgi:hypothetical protein